jgi:L-fuconate dehydratase
MKVGANLDDDMRRAAIVREEIGPNRMLMMDANQAWDVGTAIHHMKKLAQFNP